MIVTLELTQSVKSSVSPRCDVGGPVSHGTIEGQRSRETGKVKEAAGQKHVITRVQMVDLAGSEKEQLDAEAGTSSTLHSAKSQSGGSGSRRAVANASINGLSSSRDLEAEKIELKAIRRSLSTLGYIIKELGL